MTEFDLKKKRKELFSYLKDQFGEYSILPPDILKVVEKQDEEFIRQIEIDLLKKYKMASISIMKIIKKRMGGLGE